MDKDGSGEIGYDEFTMLTEERWRGIDPFEVMKQNTKMYEQYMTRNSDRLDTHESNETTVIPALNDDQHRFHRLENLSKNHLKIPLTKSKGPIDVININRASAKDKIANSLKMSPMGMPSA